MKYAFNTYTMVNLLAMRWISMRNLQRDKDTISLTTSDMTIKNYLLVLIGSDPYKSKRNVSHEGIIIKMVE